MKDDTIKDGTMKDDPNVQMEVEVVPAEEEQNQALPVKVGDIIRHHRIANHAAPMDAVLAAEWYRWCNFLVTDGLIGSNGKECSRAGCCHGQDGSEGIADAI